MVWKIEYTAQAQRQLGKIDRQTTRRILKFMEEKIATHPNPQLLSKALKGNLGSYDRFRVGNYRVICQIQAQILKILVVRLGHRNSIYQDLNI